MKIPVEVEVFIKDQLKEGTDLLTLYYLVREKFLKSFKRFPSYQVFQKMVTKIKENIQCTQILTGQTPKEEDVSKDPTSLNSIEEILKLKSKILTDDSSAFNKKEALELLIGACIERINSLESSNNGQFDVRVEQLINRYLTEIRQIIIEMTKLQGALQEEIDSKFQEVLNDVLIEFLMFVIVSLREVFGDDPRINQVLDLVVQKCENSVNLSSLKKEDLTKFKVPILETKNE